MSPTMSSSSTIPKYKSKSISNLPLPHSLHHLTENTTAPSSPKLRLKPKMSTHNSSSMIPRTSSIRSPPIHSPSPLPSTESLSYFPPFESMGSEDDLPEPPRSDEPIAGPSRPSSHIRGKSMTSLAGLMSVCLSTISPSTSMALLPSTDGEAVQALTKRCTPGKGKRRVLEPLTVNDGEVDVNSTLSLHHKRRMRSEVVIEDMLGRVKAGLADTTSRGTEDEDAIERLISNVRFPHHRTACGADEFQTPAKQGRKPNMSLQVPPSSIPSWRFPLPSPPIASLSPDIPNDAFHRLIDNPLSLSSSHDTSIRQSADVDQIEEDLSPTRSISNSSSPASSPPCTPPHKLSDKRIRVQRASTSPSLKVFTSPTSRGPEGYGYGRDLKLVRSVSGMSSDSKRTIRPGHGGWEVEEEGEGEVTPKAVRGYGGMVY
jgi:hypothetical protein